MPDAHISKARVSYADTDQAGVVYHSNYLRWFEVGRTEFLRDLGFPYADMERDLKLRLAVVEAHLEYQHPARYDEELLVESSLGELKRVRLRIDHRVRRGSDGVAVCSGYIWLACVTFEGQVAPLPQGLRSILTPKTSPEDGKRGTDRLVSLDAGIRRS